jgi:hypothetical protein
MGFIVLGQTNPEIVQQKRAPFLTEKAVEFRGEFSPSPS